jgi:hypothetical protein
MKKPSWTPDHLTSERWDVIEHEMTKVEGLFYINRSSPRKFKHDNHLHNYIRASLSVSRSHPANEMTRNNFITTYTKDGLHPESGSWNTQPFEQLAKIEETIIEEMKERDDWFYDWAEVAFVIDMEDGTFISNCFHGPDEEDNWDVVDEHAYEEFLMQNFGEDGEEELLHFLKERIIGKGQRIISFRDVTEEDMYYVTSDIQEAIEEQAEYERLNPGYPIVSIITADKPEQQFTVHRIISEGYRGKQEPAEDINPYPPEIQEILNRYSRTRLRL